MGITKDQIYNILDGENVDALLDLVNSSDLDEELRADFIANILSSLDALFYEGLPELVVRVCVEAPEKTAEAARHSFLSSWLRHGGYHQRPDIIRYVIQKLRDEEGERLVAAVKTAWVVGYRDEELQAELERIAGLRGESHSEDDCEGYALAVLASMAYPDLDAITGKLRSRLERIGQLTEPDGWVARHAATPDMIPFLKEAAPTVIIATGALMALPGRYPDAAPAVLNAFMSLDERERFGYTSALADRVDLEGVGEFLLAEVLDAFRPDKSRNVLPPVTYLLEANRRNHINFFVKAGNSISPEMRAWLMAPAIAKTGNKSNFQTGESLKKEYAWNVILRLGLEEARSWLTEAMEGEVNFTFLRLAEFASFLQVRNAVELLGSVVRDETVDYRFGLGSLQPLGAIGSREALDALLESRVHKQRGGNGQYPLALVEALTSACMALNSYDRVWDILRDREANDEIRKVCAYVIEDLSTLENAPLPDAADLVALLRAEGPDLPGYDQLLLSLTRMSREPVVVEFLRGLAATEYDSDALTQVLAYAKLLIEFPKRLERLGLERGGDVWTVKGDLSVIVAFALFHLYRTDQSFEPALRQALEGDSFYPALQILGNLKSSDAVSEETREALWDLSKRWNGPNSAHRSSLEAVARAWPEVLLRDSALEIVSQWGTSARRAYLTALRIVFREHGHADGVADIACRFIEDADSDVRRDAARLALECDPSKLRQAVDHLAESRDGLDQAVFMLDAAFWLESAWGVFEALGRSHREPSVRELAQRLGREREDLDLARAYLPTILESQDYLTTWCYGQALVELGNEETVDLIYANLPPEVYRRSYLIWLAKQLGKRLERDRKEQTNKFYLPPPADRERSVKVIVEMKGEALGSFAGVLRESQTRRAHRWLWSWSVDIENERDLVQSVMARGADDEIFIKTDDGRRGQVIPVKTELSSGEERPSARLLLLGKGALE